MLPGFDTQTPLSTDQAFSSKIILLSFLYYEKITYLPIHVGTELEESLGGYHVSFFFLKPALSLPKGDNWCRQT